MFVYESETNKGKISESDITENDNKAKTDVKKSDSKPELPPSMAELRNLTSKTRETQSGPLMPGIVLSNSQSERARNVERFMMIYLFLHLSFAFLLNNVQF